MECIHLRQHFLRQKVLFSTWSVDIIIHMMRIKKTTTTIIMTNRSNIEFFNGGRSTTKSSTATTKKDWSLTFGWSTQWVDKTDRYHDNEKNTLEEIYNIATISTNEGRPSWMTTPNLNQSEVRKIVDIYELIRVNHVESKLYFISDIVFIDIIDNNLQQFSSSVFKRQHLQNRDLHLRDDIDNEHNKFNLQLLVAYMSAINIDRVALHNSFQPMRSKTSTTRRKFDIDNSTLSDRCSRSSIEGGVIDKMYIDKIQSILISSKTLKTKIRRQQVQ